MARAHERARRQLLWALVAGCLLTWALIWVGWVLPVAHSVERATPVDLGQSLSVVLSADERAGIWVSGASALLGTVRCTARAGTESLPLRRVNALGWEDTLWWFTPRQGFVQRWQVRAVGEKAGPIVVRCADSLDRYGGEFLVAADTSGSGSVMRGVPMGTALALGAVWLPLFVLILVPTLIVQALRRRGSARQGGHR